MSNSLLQNLRNDIVGGLVSSAVAIPLAIGFGMFAFVTLGDEYFAHGAIAGLISAFVAGILCVVFGDRTTTVYAPRITTTFFIGLLLYSLVHSDAPALKGASVSTILLIFFSTILLGGAFQALFGLMRLGTLIKYAPHPVMAGFQNMAAVLLFLVQLSNVLGYDHTISFTQVLQHIGEVKPLNVLVALVTFIAMWNAKKFAGRVPPLLVGLGCGLVVHYGLVAFGFGPQLGHVIGTPPANVSVPRPIAQFSDLINLRPLWDAATIILTGALALAIIASIDALLCAKLVSQPGEKRSDSDHLLVRLGLANVGAACLGGITSGINIGASITNRAFGGRTPVSVLVNAAALLAAFTLLFPFVAYLPRAVLSAVIMVIAVQHIDPWTTRLATRLFKRDTTQRNVAAVDLGVALIVSILSIAVNIVLAVFLGVALAVFLFVLRMSRSNIRRLYRCDSVRSRKSRGTGEMLVLEVRGGSIVVIELQGALFFGSGERLAQVIDTETAKSTGAVILDLRRVTEIDATGAQILSDINAALARKKIKLALVRSARSETAARLADIGGANTYGFQDIDRAIEWAEDDLLATASPTEAAAEMMLERVSALRDFSPDQITRLRRHLTRVKWSAGQVIFKEGDPGSDLFFVTRGRASVYLRSDGGNIRLVTFAPGTVFGELAILDRGPRSATVIADEDVTAFSLSLTGFDTLRQDEPDIAVKLLSALGRELSDRLRRANRTIHQLEA
jgi:MFS superfamily sulfate permease-like transporter